MTKKIDFSQLSLRDTFDLAITIEEEAQQRYQELAEQLEAHRTFEAAEFFRFMADNEAKHAAQLRQERSARFADEPSTADASWVFEIEAPEYQQARASMSVQAAFQVAMACERKAHDFFDQALPTIKDPEVLAIFEQLRAEEEEHERKLQDTLSRLPEEDGFDPADFADPPQAQ